MGQYTPEQISQAIFGQESSYGKADTSQENYAGARGPMQVTKPTFEGLKKAGLIPATYQHDNPEHTSAAGRTLVQHLYDKFDGSPEKVAASYYAGEKAVRADGSIVNFKDLKNPGAPSTHQYVQDILGRLGIENESDVVGTADTEDRLAVPMQHDRGYKAPKAVKFKSAPEDGPMPEPFAPALPTVTGGLSDPLTQEALEREAATRKEVQRVESVDFIDRVRISSLYEGAKGFAFRSAVRPDFEPTPGYRVDPKAFEGLSENEVDDIAQTGSTQETEYRLLEIKERRSQMADLHAAGGFQALAAGIVGNLDEAVIGGLGVARIMALRGISAAQYAARGSRGAALAASVGENAIGGALPVAVQSKFDPYTGAADVGMAMILGGGISAIEARGLLKAAGSARDVRSALEHEVDRLTTAAAAERNAIEAKAVENLGADATSEALSAEARRIESESIRQSVARHQGTLPQERVLVSEDIRRDLYGDDAVTGKADELAAKDSPRLAAEDAVRQGADGSADVLRAARIDWDSPQFLKQRRIETANNPRANNYAMTASDGEYKSYSDMNARAPVGVSVTAAAKADVSLRPAIEAIQDLAPRYLGKDVKVVVGTGVVDKTANGEALSTGGKLHSIGLRPQPGAPTDVLHAGMHELSHVIWHEHAQFISPEAMAKIRVGYAGFLADLKARSPEAAFKRYSTTSSSAGVGVPSRNAYNASFDEYVAEQIVKHFEAQAIKNPSVYSPSLVKRLTDAIRAIVDFFTEAQRKGYAKPDEGIDELLTQILNGQFVKAGQVESLVAKTDTDSVLASAMRAVTDEDLAGAYHFDTLPKKTPQQRAEFKAVADLYRRASDAQAPWNHPDRLKNLSKLLDTAPMRGAQSVSATMLRSENPVMRMLAAELLESPSGAGGRRTTAAIAKWMHEQKYMGRSILEVQDQYRTWRNDQGGNFVGDVFNGKLWKQFNRRVAEEVENRRWGRTEPQHEAVVKAADSLEAAYERMRIAQITEKTVGWAGLPETSRGYMPHRMSAAVIRNLTDEKRFVLRRALSEQFQEIEGFDVEFSHDLAKSYLERIRERGVGEIDPAVGIHQVGAADIVEDALKAMNMKPDEIRAMMQKYMRGAPGYTKRRLGLDLTKPYETADGMFTLLDVFETDQLSMLRSQARRVSGETALVRHGIMGKPGMNLMRRAVGFGGEGGKAQPHELRAFDQMAAEFFGDRFGEQGGKWMDRALQVTSLTRLGGMGFTQFAESINMVAHVGVVRALSSIGSLNRLRREALALSRGEAVDNSILKSLEQFGGAEFGTENRKMVFPFDNPDLQYQTFGQDTEYAADRLLRGGVHLQGKLSLWQAIHGAQQRGAAEQIVKKAFEYIKSGKADKALDDMGIDDSLRFQMREELDQIAKFDGNTLTDLDITKMKNLEAAETFVQAVHRGSAQIIQGTFIGERGAWAHDGQMKLLTQFRTFSLTAIEKQWARQVNIGGGGLSGHARAAGILMGAMSFAAPIYIARVYTQSIGREDREAYLERRLAPSAIARAVMNYVALTGLAGDFLDAGSQITGLGKAAGPRGGSGERDFFGDLVAPSIGVANDLYKGIQDTKEGTDPTKLMRTLPFSNLPFVLPVINSMGD